MISRSAQRRSLTLVELVVVLLILVAVSTVALTSTERVVDQGRYDATTRQLEQIRFATYGPEFERDAAGLRRLSGFAIDLGRLPERQASAGPEAELQELWDGTGLVAYGTYAAAEDAEVELTYGWRGPYLSFPVGASPQLLDGWGRSLQLLEAATPPNTTTADGAEVARVVSFGADGSDDTLTAPADPFDNDVELSLSAERFDLTADVEVNTLPAGERVVVALYEANDANTPAVSLQVLNLTTPGTETVTFTGVVPGLKVLRAYRGVGYATPPADFTGASDRSALAPISSRLYFQTEIVPLELP